MHQSNEYVLVTLRDDQIVGGDRTHSLPQPHQLAQRIWHQGQLRSPPHVIDLAICMSTTVPSAVSGSVDHRRRTALLVRWQGRSASHGGPQSAEDGPHR